MLLLHVRDRDDKRALRTAQCCPRHALFFKGKESARVMAQHVHTLRARYGHVLNGHVLS